MDTQNDTSNDIITEGDHPVQLYTHAIGEAGTGTPQIVMGLKITEGPFAGRRLTYYGFFSEKTVEHTFKAMRALGWKGNDLEDCSSMYPDNGGQVASAVVEHEWKKNEETGDEECRARVRWINQIGVAMKNKYEGGNLKAFANKMKGLAMKHGGGGSSGGNSSSSERKLPPAGSKAPQGNKSQGAKNPSWMDDDAPPPDDQDAPPAGSRSNRR